MNEEDRPISETKTKLLKHFLKNALSSGGKPRKYNDPKELAEKVHAYFEEFEKWSLEGLAIYLGFASRQSIYDLPKQGPEYSYILRQIRDIMCSKLAEGLDDKRLATTGLIFHLKQFSWKDTVENTNIEYVQIDAPSFGDRE